MARNTRPANEQPARLSANASVRAVGDEAIKTPERTMAEALMAGKLGNAAVAQDFSTAHFGAATNLTECTRALCATVDRVKAGDLGIAESLLTGQALALNSIFTALAHRASSNLGQYPEAVERYLRLALKAQGQARATLETLAAIKNPPVVFARQANIAHGPQQVVNGGAAGPPAVGPRAESFKAAPNELLEATHGQRLDTGATSAASGADPHLATVGAVDRAAH